MDARRTSLSLVLLGASFGLGGCVRYEVVHYLPLELPLDATHTLRISTYPSWFPRETDHVPFLYKTVRTPETVHFQVWVQSDAAASGAKPATDTVRIDDFSYELPGQSPVRLIADFDGHFWMQDQPQYNPNKTTPVPCLPGKPVSVHVSLSVDQTAYVFDRELPCAVRERTGSLLVHALLR